MENEEKQQWSMCCSKSSSTFVKYIVQVIIALIILIFSIIKLSINSNEDKAIYISLISTILGLFIPAPSSAKAG